MEKRDLQNDLTGIFRTPKIAEAKGYAIDQETISMTGVRQLAALIEAAREGWPHAIERALAAETKLAGLESNLRYYADFSPCASRILDAYLYPESK